MPGEKDDRTRIVFLGDSQTEARQVLLDSTYPRRLERMCLDVEAINLGESGVGQVEMLQHLRELGPRLEPDIVVASFLAHNDVSDNLPRLEQNRGEPKPDEWAETSARADAAPDTLWTEAWARTEAAFDSLALWSTRHDARFGVWFTPGRTHAQGRDERSVTELRMMAYLRAADIPVLPVARELLELPPDERLATAYTGDSHMTARGHAFVAERLAAGLGWACDGIEGGTRQP